MKKRIVLSLAIIAGFCCLFFLPKTESKKLVSSQTQRKFSPNSDRRAFALRRLPCRRRSAVSRPPRPKTAFRVKKRRTKKRVPCRTICRLESKFRTHRTTRIIIWPTSRAHRCPRRSFHLTVYRATTTRRLTVFAMIPPDTFGDVGLNHYVQAVNALDPHFRQTGKRAHAAI